MSASRATCWLSGPAAGATIFNCGASAAALSTRSGGVSFPEHALPANPQSGRDGGGGDDTYIWLFPGAPVRKERLIARDPLERGAGKRRDLEAALRESARELGFRRRCDDDGSALGAPCSGARGAAVVAVEGDVMRDEESHRLGGRDLDTSVSSCGLLRASARTSIVPPA